MTFETLEQAQREAAYLKTKHCASINSCSADCPAYIVHGFTIGNCNNFVMNNALAVIEKFTGEKCTIEKPVSEMQKEMALYCDNQIPSCNSCIFSPIEYSDGYCLIRDCKKSDGLVKLLYDYYENHKEESE